MLLSIDTTDSGIFLHVLQFDNDMNHSIALVTSLDNEKFFVDSSHGHFLKASKENFIKLGYKKVLDACHVDWSLLQVTSKKRKKKGARKARARKSSKSTQENDVVSVENKSSSSVIMEKKGKVQTSKGSGV